MRIEIRRLLLNTRALGVLALLMGLITVMPNAMQAQNTEENGRSAVHAMTITQLQDKFYKTEIEQEISVDVHELTLEQALRVIASETGLRLSYRGDIMVDKMISLQEESISISGALAKILESTGLDYKFSQDGYLLITEKENDLLYEMMLQETIRGTVVDAQTGEALPGVNVVVGGTDGQSGSVTGTTTDVDGYYELQVSEGTNILVFTYIGFRTQQVPIDGRTEIDVEMQPEIISGAELVVVGYGTQTRETLTGSVSAIRSEELVTTRNENPQNLLTGKVAGVRVVQNSSEPGAFNNEFDIRGLGNPLIVIDGVPRENFVRMNPEDIESISVLKDASAAVYGVRAANGVVLITTKRGDEESMKLSYSGNMGLQYPSGSPRSVSAADWMVLQNERNMHNVNGGARRFSDEEIEEYRSGAKQGTDWYSSVMRMGAPQTNHTLSASGMAGGIQYYTSLGYQYQESFLRSDDLNYNRVNLRANISSDISEYLTLGVNLNGITDQRNRPDQNADWIIRSFQRSNPTQPIYANNTPPYYQEGTVDGSNPITMMDADVGGYRSDDNKWFESSMTVDYEVPGINSLVARAMGSYDIQVGDNRRYIREFEQYNYDAASDSYIPVTKNSPNRYRSDYSTREALLYQLSLIYTGSVADGHDIDAMVLWEGSKRQADNFYAQRELALDLDRLFAGNSTDQIGSMSANPADLYEDANQGLVGKFGYGYRSKYLAEFSFRYDGSSKFDEENQWGFFPAVSVGWLISEEDFWRNMGFDFIGYAKIRASYGVMGDDGASRYQFVSGYTYPAGGSNNRLPGGHIFDGNFVSASANRGIANPNITWYTAEMANVGLEFDLWSGILEVEMDYFIRDRSGLLATRAQSLPDVIGANLPQENLNGDLTKGFELQLNHRNTLGDFNYSIKGLFSYTRTRNQYIEYSGAGNSYLNWRNNMNDRLHGVWWGYGDVGRYTSYEDIANSDIYTGRGTLPGDYILQDWNGDGIISNLDQHPISYSGIPLINFGFTFNAQYLGFDVNMHFQGAALNYVQYEEQLIEPMWGSANSNALEMFLDRWRPVNPHADPYDHDTEWIQGHYAYTGTVAPGNSYFRINKGDYVRLKSIEIGYNLPQEWASLIGVRGARVYANGYNLLTLTRMDYIDPEHPSDNWGNLYPLNKTVSAGINIEF